MITDQLPLADPALDLHAKMLQDMLIVYASDQELTAANMLPCIQQR